MKQDNSTFPKVTPRRHNTKATSDLQGSRSGLGFWSHVQASAEERERVKTASQFCSSSTQETLIKPVLMPSGFLAEEKISEIMNRKPFVNWQVLNKYENASGSTNKISMVN